MDKIGLNELRTLFKDFYVNKDHYPAHSASLIPQEDKSLLIINSGMAPLKPYFAGAKVPPSKRMTTCQKCIRTGDIENVGHTARHATFFEMLGSFSFGDYFKEESLRWGLEFVLDVLKIPMDRLWVTVYEEDDESVEIWKNLGFPQEKIVKLGKEDNFWEIGLGPCGPCSEIYFDKGEAYGCNSSDCKPGCECDRYMEFWNHVFTQFSKNENGEYTPLENPNIDTGMGIERLACIMQGVDSIFEIDTFKEILDEVVNISGVKYANGNQKHDVSIRIITDHIRSIVFMIGDDIRPSNEGRGYVLRRLLRRAARHGRAIGISDVFLVDLSEKVIETCQGAYPELFQKKDYIQKVIAMEEEKFAQTIDQGTAIIQDYIDDLKNSGNNVLPGDKVFKLYDTFGFPVELTVEILEENDCQADIEGFDSYMQMQKEKARAARKSSDDTGWNSENVLHDFPDTEFTGYNNYSTNAKVLKIMLSEAEVNSASVGMRVNIIMEKTPLYTESGGQVSDIGTMSNDSFFAKVNSVIKNGETVLHEITIDNGEVSVGDDVDVIVDKRKRLATEKNHTATHLLHKTLREVLGTHVTQAGSLVNENILRFDFTNFSPLTTDEIMKIERKVNDNIFESIDVNDSLMTIEEAKDMGAMALFSEKYGNEVRVINIENCSIELCGGTHVRNTAHIGGFKIISETGVASGVRRIEAITGEKVIELLNNYDAKISAVSEILKTNKANLESKATQVIQDLKEASKEIEKIKKDSMSGELDDIIKSGETIGELTLITKKFENFTIDDLRKLSDDIKSKCKSSIMVFSNVSDDKVTFLVSITNDLLDKGFHAGNMIKQIAATCGGGGGGKADMAQAGAKDISKVDDAMQLARELVEKQ